MEKRISIFIILAILLIAFFIRFYNIEKVPAGLGTDGVVQAYNAFSLLHTGKDRYGEPFPILFRLHNLNGSYQPPLYTYLTVIPVAIFDNSVFSAYFVSIFSGTLLVLITYLIVILLFENKNEPHRSSASDVSLRASSSLVENKHILALIAAFTVALSPWAVFYSRLIVEANLGLMTLALSVLLFVASLKKQYFFPIACAVLGISTFAYYSEQVIAVLFLPIFVLLFKKNFFMKTFSLNNRWLLLGGVLFISILLFHIQTFKNGAFARRFNQVSYLNSQPATTTQSQIFNKVSEPLKSFSIQYLSYYNPSNLFFSTDPKLGRQAPELGVFYIWMIIPFFLGLRYLIKNYKTSSSKVLLSLFLITPVAAGVTADVFYPLRTLSFLWIVTLIVAVGIYSIYLFLKPNFLKVVIFSILVIYSLFSLYVSYFILFRYEMAKDFGYPYQELLEKINVYNDKKIVIDSTRDSGLGIRLAYLREFDPRKMQNQLRNQLTTPYYTSTPNYNETYKMDNIEVRPINWADACLNDVIFIGDSLAISEDKAKEHNLRPLFSIKDLFGENILSGYMTTPKQEC